jgi:hypothetical protein
MEYSHDEEGPKTLKVLKQRLLKKLFHEQRSFVHEKTFPKVHVM